MARMMTKIIIFFMCLAVAFSNESSEDTLKESTGDLPLTLVLDYKYLGNYLAFILEKEARFAITVNGQYMNQRRDSNFQQLEQKWFDSGKKCEWNIMKINEETVKVFGEDYDFQIHDHSDYGVSDPKLHEQEVIIKSESRMLWKVCSSLHHCSLPIPESICKPGQETEVNIQDQKSKPPSEYLDVFLGATCFILTIVVLILTIYIIKEKKERPREANPNIPLASNHKETEPPRCFNQPSQRDSHEANPTNPNEHTYEEIDEYNTSSHPSKSEVKEAGPSNPKEHVYEEIDEYNTSSHPSKSEVNEAGPSNPKEHIYEEIDESKISHRPSKLVLYEADSKVPQGDIHQPPRCPSGHESVNSLYGAVIQQDH